MHENHAFFFYFSLPHFEIHLLSGYLLDVSLALFRPPLAILLRRLLTPGPPAAIAPSASHVNVDHSLICSYPFLSRSSITGLRTISWTVKDRNTSVSTYVRSPQASQFLSSARYHSYCTRYTIMQSFISYHPSSCRLFFHLTMNDTKSP